MSQDDDDEGRCNVNFIFKGKTSSIEIGADTTVGSIYEEAISAFHLPENVNMKLLFKGKVIGGNNNRDNNNKDNQELAFPTGIIKKNKSSKKTTTLKILVMVTMTEEIKELNNKRSDPTIRGFPTNDDDADNKSNKKGGPMQVWGPETSQHKEYKFCKFESCSWQSFGHRPNSQTPHSFQAMKLLEKLATDPGIVSIMVERELVVGTLGEIDPIDDRLMKQKKSQGSHLLGYNTNMGSRIDLKLRTDDLKGFLPYHMIAATLAHELSHNWVAEHNALFWTNYGQMRLEYLYRHTALSVQGYIIEGKTTADIAGVANIIQGGMRSIIQNVLSELRDDMVNYGLSVEVVSSTIQERGEELLAEHKKSENSQILGGGKNEEMISGAGLRNLALTAAEKRMKQNEKEREYRTKDK